MKKSMGLVALLSAVAMLVPTASHAGGHTTTYVAAAVVSSTVTVAAPSPVGKVSPLGGFRFTPTTTKVRVTIVDAAGTAVPYSVCQEGATDPAKGDTTLCGDHSTDVSHDGLCNKGGTYGGFAANEPVAIFIFSTGDVTNEACAEALGTTGKLSAFSAV